MTALEDVITYLEMLDRPSGKRVPAPFEKLALMRAEDCTVSFYRYMYDTVGRPWLWFERRLVDDAALAALIAKPTIEIFVLYVAGVPAGFFELDTAPPRETKLCYFGLIPDFLGQRLGPYATVGAPTEAVPDAARWHHRVLGARQYTIAGGTSEIQRNIIGERVLGLPKG